MKKIYLSLIAVLAVCHFTYAQWTTNSANTVTSTPNTVGIGTTTPATNAALTIVRGGTNSGADYPSLHIETNGTGNIYGPILYLNGLSGTSGRMWGLVSSGPLDAAATGAAGNFAIYDVNSGSRLVINSTGNVGIGTTNPTTGLLVAQGLITSQTATTLSTGNNDAFNLFAGGGGYANGARQSILWSQSGLTLGRFGTEYNAPRGQIDFVWRDQYNNGASSNESMRLTGGGNLGIGTINPDQKLTVKGTIHSQAVIVDNNILPDYVFKPDYKLVSLKDVKTYIDKNHHLSEIPSAKTVARQGLNLGEMNTLLLKKVEELTLYTIASDKEIKDEKAVIAQQQADINELKKQMALLMKPLHK